MPQDTLEITVPEYCSDELEYVVHVVFREFWEIPYQLRVENQTHVSISAKGSTRSIVINSEFFRVASRNWLGSETLPKIPLSSFMLDEYDFFTDLDFTELPILYGSPHLVLGENYIEVKFDILGAVFFMLSRYEEYFDHERDKHNRFQERFSLGHKAGFQNIPIVNQYLEVLWKVLKHAGFLVERRHRLFRIEPTCDLDWPFEPAYNSIVFAFKNGVRSMINDLSLKTLLVNLGKYFLGNRFAKDENLDGINWIMKICEAADLRAQFYCIPMVTHKADCSNDPFSTKFKSLVTEILGRGHFIGMHPGYLCFVSEDHFDKSTKAFRRLLTLLEKPTIDVESRMHYLRWKFPETLKLYSKFNVRSDSTMAYAETPGFRSGVCYEYTMYDAASRTVTSIKQKPLILMEASLLDAPYMALGHSEQAKKIALELKRQCKLYNGSFRLLWHNCHLSSQADRDFFKLLVEN
tara:strand:+ start:748 stop:2139 length:1392 start_codon:yes stop_codon:yes gene_type:complete